MRCLVDWNHPPAGQLSPMKPTDDLFFVLPDRSFGGNIFFCWLPVRPRLSQATSRQEASKTPFLVRPNFPTGQKRRFWSIRISREAKNAVFWSSGRAEASKTPFLAHLDFPTGQKRRFWPTQPRRSAKNAVSCSSENSGGPKTAFLGQLFGPARLLCRVSKRPRGKRERSEVSLLALGETRQMPGICLASFLLHQAQAKSDTSDAAEASVVQRSERACRMRRHGPVLGFHSSRRCRCPCGRGRSGNRRRLPSSSDDSPRWR